MRYTRLRKFRDKNKPLINFVKIFLIFYFSLLSLNNLTSDTNALFKDEVKNSSNLKANLNFPQEIWDKSSLKLSKTDFSCDEGVTAEITNTGSTMKGTTKFFVRYASSDSINKNYPGTIIFEGEVPIIEKEKTVRLKFLPNFKDGTFKQGFYEISALQRPSHPGGTENESKEYKGRFEIWADKNVQVTDGRINSCNQK
ncbi:amyloid fiber anchoring/assembly protein TapA [Neobacillus drentensis]|uniref:amyloid fiber anchoring/assembly protein TapA n=1 Tax=Neobacillus drentensis TaxID=220684 RepID=UPI003001363B